MTESCVLYYITDRHQFSADEYVSRKHLLAKIREAACAGVDYIQLREKDLRTREMEALSRDAVKVLDELRTENPELRTALLINSRTDIALAVGADGVHLRSDDISPKDVRAIWKAGYVGTAARESSPQLPLVGVSCHTPEEVNHAAENAVNFAAFAPVFEKYGATPAGLDRLRQACRASIPVLALGGVTLENAESCLQAGAAGIAGIRLFQENNIAEVVHKLRH
ncbi:MAG TPA: thiamine phosphate synthase [Candidatus Sulfotelmatobacter sp.]